MVTYEVKCGWCAESILQEHAKPLKDPGTLNAFCSVQCSREWFKKFIADPWLAGTYVEVSCGCQCVVTWLDETVPLGGHGMAWATCEKTAQKPQLGIDSHTCEILREACGILEERINKQS